MNRLFRKHAYVVAVAALCLSFPAKAQAPTTVLGPVTTPVTVGTSAILAALPANPTRKAVTICNGSGTAANLVTFTTGSVTPVSGTTGVVLPGGNAVASCFTLGNPGLPNSGGVGAQINVIGSTSSLPVTFVEFF